MAGFYYWQLDGAVAYCFPFYLLCSLSLLSALFRFTCTSAHGCTYLRIWVFLSFASVSSLVFHRAKSDDTQRVSQSYQTVLSRKSRCIRDVSLVQCSSQFLHCLPAKFTIAISSRKTQRTIQPLICDPSSTCRFYYLFAKIRMLLRYFHCNIRYIFSFILFKCRIFE